MAGERDARDFWETGEEPDGPFRVTPGFLAFLGAMILPVLAGFVIFFGAWLVSADVYAAEESERITAASFGEAREDEVAGWKKALVGICPLH